MSKNSRIFSSRVFSKNVNQTLSRFKIDLVLPCYGVWSTGRPFWRRSGALQGVWREVVSRLYVVRQFSFLLLFPPRIVVPLNKLSVILQDVKI